MGARQELATAASTVIPVGGTDPLNVTPYYRQSLTPGHGFVRLANKARSTDGFGFMDTWEVWLALPQDIPTAEKWLENNTDALIAALAPLMVITTITPSELVLDANSVPGVVIAGAREG